LDPGFYAREIFPHISIKTETPKLRVSITPRKDMFINQEDYFCYVSNLLNFVKKLQKEFDVEIYLTSLAFDADYDAIKDVIHNLRILTDSRLKSRFQVIKFTNLNDAWQFYSTMDIIVTSRMHDGISGMSASKPAIFVFSI
jgi:polysaccharide pyruvyl transferase WcaK-like protein